MRLRDRVRIFALAGPLWALGGVCGCRAPQPPLEVSHPDPSIKIPAIKKAVREQDHDAVAQLVKDLDSDDPAVRFFSIKALHRLVGQNFGYHYYQDEEARKPAVERWRQWLEETDPEP